MPFELYCNNRQKGTWRWNLKARNGEIIATSETYSTKQGALKGIKSVKKNAVLSVFADVKEVESPKKKK